MLAMIFAAGEGRRMRPLTLHTPKPLLQVGQYSLLEHQLRKLAAAGVSRFVINVSYLKDALCREIEQLRARGWNIDISEEAEPLETGGGLLHALPLLGEQPFVLVNADIWCEFNYRDLLAKGLADDKLAHLVLVSNPEHNAAGDFHLSEQGTLSAREPDVLKPAWTFSGISLIHPSLIAAYRTEYNKFPLRDVLREAMSVGKVSGELYAGMWMDIGTPERLQELIEYTQSAL